MVGRPFEILKVFLRIVPLIENQSDALTFLSEHLVASDQIVQNPAEGDRVVLVPLVDLGEQRDMKIPGDQQRPAHDAQIVAFGLGVPAPRQCVSRLTTPR